MSEDSQRFTTEGPADTANTRGSASSASFWVEYRGTPIELRGGQLLVGRSAMCRLVLDDPLVSRQHAEFRLEDGKVWLFDLKSVNGVLVNGRRLENKCVLRAGDKVTIGEQELTLLARPTDNATARHVPERRHLADTLHGSFERPLVASTAPNRSRDPNAEDATTQGEALDLLGGVADKVLALGRGEEAERILATYLNNLLDSARSRESVSTRSADKAVCYAVKLASVTGKGSWVDYAFALHTLLTRLLPASAVDELYEVLRKVPGVSLQGVRDYIAALHKVQSKFGPAERFVMQRVEGLERLLALR